MSCWSSASWSSEWCHAPHRPIVCVFPSQPCLFKRVTSFSSTKASVSQIMSCLRTASLLQYPFPATLELRYKDWCNFTRRGLFFCGRPLLNVKDAHLWCVAGDIHITPFMKLCLQTNSSCSVSNSDVSVMVEIMHRCDTLHANMFKICRHV